MSGSGEEEGRDERRSDTAALYEIWTLDIVPTLGRQAAKTFEGNPKQFKRVPPDIAERLSRLHYRTGYGESYLDKAQRLELIKPLLGHSDGMVHDDNTSRFHAAAAGLRQAAVDYVQRSFDTGERQLRNAFRDAAKTMYAYLTVIDGAVTTNAGERLRNHFDEMVTVLRNSEFCGGLGLPPAPPGDWPRFGTVDGDGAALIAELSERLVADEQGAPETMGVSAFVAVQRVANYGATSLDHVLRDPSMDDDGQANEVINVVYRWWTALRDFRKEFGNPE